MGWWLWKLFDPKITSSIDAAVALVEAKLPGWRKQFFEMRTGYIARLTDNATATTFSNDLMPARSFTLAILQALLRALIAQQEEAANG